MSKPLAGKAWVFGHDIDTDQIIRTGFLQMFLSDEELAKQAMVMIDPTFAQEVQPGDLMVVGENFGCGSSREEAVMALKACRIAGVLGTSFSRIFYRNAIHQGLRVWEVPELQANVETGDRICVWPEEGRVTVEDDRFEGHFKPLPEYLERIVRAGGLVPYHQERLKQ